MKNKIELKKICLCLAGLALVFFLALTLSLRAQYRIFTANYNNKLDLVVGKLLERYPELGENEVIELLNDDSKSGNSIIWNQYGIDLSKDALIMENERYSRFFLAWDLGICVLFVLASAVVTWIYLRHRNRKLGELTHYLEELNRRNYKLEISGTSEDELSILKSEIYKTTVLLKESAENSLLDKKNLKDSLSDISHQLKTPLTSILIMLDNMIDNPDMDAGTRQDFVESIRREVTNLNFFVGAILKLSRFDANTVHLKSSTVAISDLLADVAQNVAVLCDLREVELRIEGERESTIDCDRKWQAEALTNIVKDSIEHSAPGTAIDISYSVNRLYAQIVIEDHGSGIAEEDLPHIFERFYRGGRSSEESVGIGLALAKSIIEAEQGRIHVESKPGEGTRFEIIYDC